MVALVHSFQSEWLKRKGSLASWLVVIGAFFSPFIFIVSTIVQPDKVPAKLAGPKYWESAFASAWQSMNILFLPMGIVMAVALLTQLEYKNNTWKQWHSTPQSYTTIFIAKILVVLFMEVQLFILFDFGIYLTGLIPSLVVNGAHYPPAPFPWNLYARKSALFFVDNLPIVAIQFLLGLHFRNFLVTVGTGVILLFTGLTISGWRYAYWYPYSYAPLYSSGRFPEMNLHAWAVGWFIVVITFSYVLYIKKNDKS